MNKEQKEFLKEIDNFKVNEFKPKNLEDLRRIHNSLKYLLNRVKFKVEIFEGNFENPKIKDFIKQVKKAKGKYFEIKDIYSNKNEVYQQILTVKKDKINKSLVIKSKRFILKKTYFSISTNDNNIRLAYIIGENEPFNKYIGFEEISKSELSKKLKGRVNI